VGALSEEKLSKRGVCDGCESLDWRKVGVGRVGVGAGVGVGDGEVGPDMGNGNATATGPMAGGGETGDSYEVVERLWYAKSQVTQAQQVQAGYS